MWTLIGHPVFPVSQAAVAPAAIRQLDDGKHWGDRSAALNQPRRKTTGRDREEMGGGDEARENTNSTITKTINRLGTAVLRASCSPSHSVSVFSHLSVPFSALRMRLLCFLSGMLQAMPLRNCSTPSLQSRNHLIITVAFSIFHHALQPVWGNIRSFP